MGVVGNNYGMDSPRFSRDLTLQNLRNINLLVIFSILGGDPKKSMISPLLIYNKFRYHTHKIRLEKWVPLNYRFPTDNKKSSKTIDQTVFKLDFWQNSGFPKIRDLSPVAPRGVYISRNDPEQKMFFWKCQKASIIVICWQNGYLFYVFLMFCFPHGSHGS